MSTTDLAAALRISQSTLSRIENDRIVEAPEPSLLARISTVLGISQAEMLTALGYRVLAEDSPPYDDTAASIARAVAHWSPAKKRFLWSFIDAVDAASLASAEPSDDDDDGPTEATGD